MREVSVSDRVRPYMAIPGYDWRCEEGERVYAFAQADGHVYNVTVHPVEGKCMLFVYPSFQVPGMCGCRDKANFQEFTYTAEDEHWVDLFYDDDDGELYVLVPVAEDVGSVERAINEYLSFFEASYCEIVDYVRARLGRAG